MKICMLTSFFLPTIGGVEAHIYNLSQELKRMGHEIVIVHTLFEDNEKKVEIIDCDGLEVHRLYLGKRFISTDRLKKTKFVDFFSYLNGFIRKIQPIIYSNYINRYIKKLSDQKKFDLIHQHDFISNIFTTKKLKKDFSIVITNHTGEFLMLNNNHFLKMGIKYILNHIDFLIAPSKELCDVPFLKEQHKTAYIPNGVLIDKFNCVSLEEKDKKKRALGIEDKDKIVLCARRWAPTKGVIYLVKAISNILLQYPNVKFLISGNEYFGYPLYRDEILKHIDKFQISKNIILLGDIPHAKINEYYQISDVVVLPSLMEATSLSGLEAMSCGKPLVGTNIGGIPEIIEDGTTGYLVTVKNSEKLAEAIIKLLKDTELAVKMGNMARTKVEEKFSWKMIADKTVGVYERVLQMKRAY